MPVLGGGEDLEEIVHRELRHRLAIARQHGLERLNLRELGLLLHDRRHPVEAIGDLRIDRVLYPQRPILIESSNALRQRHEFWARLVGGRANEFVYCGLRGSIIPRGERIGLRERLCAQR